MSRLLTTITIERQGKAGLLEKRMFPSRSWTKHLFDLFYELYGFGAGLSISANDISSVSRSLNTIDNGANPQLAIGAPGGGIGFYQGWHGWPGGGANYATNVGIITGDLAGIIVGTGVPVVAPTDDKLVTAIAHGAAGGQFLYGGVEIYGESYVNPNGSFNIRRYFTNISGGPITVNECGIYALGYVSGINYPFCIMHDAVAPGVIVANTEILSVVYTVQITV